MGAEQQLVGGLKGAGLHASPTVRVARNGLGVTRLRLRRIKDVVGDILGMRQILDTAVNYERGLNVFAELFEVRICSLVAGHLVRPQRHLFQLRAVDGALHFAVGAHANARVRSQGPDA